MQMHTFIHMCVCVSVYTFIFLLLCKEYYIAPILINI